MRSLAVSLGCLTVTTICPAQNPDWVRVTTTTSPPGRHGHAMAYDSARQRVVLFGGGLVKLNDTWEYDGRNWTKMNPQTSPPGRFIHAMAYDSVRKRTVLFGGVGSSNPRFNDTWEWDGVNWTQIKTLNSPSVRGGHSMAYNSITGRTVMHGGTTTGACALILAGTWEYDGKNWTHVTTTTPLPARARYGMVAHGFLQSTLVFGGLIQGSCGRLNDTWEWTISKTWRQLTPTISPPARGHFQMAGDSFRRRAVLFSGSGTGITNDTWEFDGKTWAKMSPLTSPPKTTAGAMAYDSVRRRVVLFAGIGNGANTWEYGLPQTLTANPSTISIANGGTQTLTLNAGTAHANRLYWIFGSMTGTSPGTNLLGVNIPLNLDPYTDLLLGAVNTAVFANFKRALSATGAATATLNVPAKLPIPTGLKIYHAYVVYNGTTGQIYTASNPVSVELK